MPVSVLRGERAPSQLWTEQDGLLAQALTLYESMLCSCGHPMWESMDPANERRYSAPEPQRCHACTAIAQRAEKYKDTDAPSALRFHSVLHRPPSDT